MTTHEQVQPTALRWLVTGANGQLGRELMGLLGSDPRVEVRGITRADVDLADADAVGAFVEEWLGAGESTPGVVVNTAAHTAVDAAETELEAAAAGNVDAPRNLATGLAGRAQLIHVSTDYVFPGDAQEPYPVDAPTGPLTAYGRTKLAGEEAIRSIAPDTSVVVRTAWVYGAHGPNFVKTMAALSAKRDTLEVVADQVGSPTWTRHLALGLMQVATSGVPGGTLHCTGSGQASWFDLARAVFEELGLDPQRIRPTTTAAYPRPAPRPAYSVLSDAEWQAAGLTPMPHWREALHEAFAHDRSALLA